MLSENNKIIDQMIYNIVMKILLSNDKIEITDELKEFIRNEAENSIKNINYEDNNEFDNLILKQIENSIYSLVQIKSIKKDFKHIDSLLDKYFKI